MKRYHWVGMLPFYLLAVIVCIGVAVWADDAVTAVVQNTAVEREHTLVIDAGHGGFDGGATSCTGVLESQINLEIALRLNDFLQLLGYRTVMIRTEDTAVNTEGETIASKKVSDLKERVRIVNGTENAILISIHQNIFPDSRYSGAQVFYAPADGSRELAMLMQERLVTILNPGSNRSCKKADGIYLLQQVDTTGILIECGFLSNPAEEAKLRSEVYQQQLCGVIATSLSAFLEAEDG